MTSKDVSINARVSSDLKDFFLALGEGSVTKGLELAASKAGFKTVGSSDTRILSNMIMLKSLSLILQRDLIEYQNIKRDESMEFAESTYGILEKLKAIVRLSIEMDIKDVLNRGDMALENVANYALTQTKSLETAKSQVDGILDYANMFM